MLLGNVAVRLGKAIEYDGAAGRVTNAPRPTPLVRPDLPQGLGAVGAVLDRRSDAPERRETGRSRSAAGHVEH